MLKKDTLWKVVQLSLNSVRQQAPSASRQIVCERCGRALTHYREMIPGVVDNPLLDPKMHGFMDSAMEKPMDLSGTEKVTDEFMTDSWHTTEFTDRRMMNEKHI